MATTSSWIRVLVLAQLLVLGLSCRADNTDLTRPDQHPLAVQATYEAEDAELLDGITVVHDPGARGGRCLQMGDSGSVLFHVLVPDKGLYRLKIGYRAPHSDRAQRLLVNGREYAPEIGFAISPVWAETKMVSGLNAGENTVELRRSWGDMEIDYLTVEGPVTIPPDLSPVQNTVYRTPTPRDVSVKLDRNGHPLLSVTRDGVTVPTRAEEVGYTEDSSQILIPSHALSPLKPGLHRFWFNLQGTDPLAFDLEVRDTRRASDWIIICLDVRHGVSVLMLLPTGRTLLIDTGTEALCRERVLPFLDRHALSPDTLWITHYHDDHCGGKALVQERYPHLTVRDYRDFRTGDTLDFEGTRLTILNAYPDGTDENTRSLSFVMTYRGFVYTHGGDIYGDNQRRILQTARAGHRLDRLRTHVYHANHHFHGSVDVDYLRAIDPALFVVSGEEHIYGRAAYVQAVQEGVLPVLRGRSRRFIEDLLQFEVGHVVIRIQDGLHWHYETYRDPDAVIPFCAVDPVRQGERRSPCAEPGPTGPIMRRLEPAPGLSSRTLLQAVRR